MLKKLFANLLRQILTFQKHTKEHFKRSYFYENVNIFFFDVHKSPNLLHLLLWSTTSASESSSEFKVAGSGTDISFLITAPVGITVLVLVGWPGCVDTWPGLVSCLLLPLQSGGDNFGWEVEVLTEELDSLVGEGEIVVSPGEFLLEVSLGDEGLAGLHDMEVWHVNFGVFWCVWVFLADQDSLLEEVFKDEFPIPFWHEHDEFLD